uniref:Uncharacterized protein n=1 Tax=Salix viminalis TaxID=40686 RepID=A0A6N2LIY9_SALVM
MISIYGRLLAFDTLLSSLCKKYNLILKKQAAKGKEQQQQEATLSDTFSLQRTCSNNQRVPVRGQVDPLRTFIEEIISELPPEHIREVSFADWRTLIQACCISIYFWSQ